jgi:hypothetical protein
MVNQLIFWFVMTLAALIWMVWHRFYRTETLGSVSARWLHEYRGDTHRQR